MYIKEIDANVFVVPQGIPLFKALQAFGLEDANVQIADDLEEYYFIISKKIHTEKYYFEDMFYAYLNYVPDDLDIEDVAIANGKGIKAYFQGFESLTIS